MNEYIQYEKISFAYGLVESLEDWVIRDIDLSIAKGEFHVIVGPSGCGKTTLLNLLAGFDTPTSGQILVNGQVVEGPGVDRIVIFQGDDSLYPWLTALENVEFGLRLAGKTGSDRSLEAQKYLDLVGLDGQEAKFPDQLSGGMKQRVQLARALASHTNIFLMDEPFGALDAQTRSVLQKELIEIWERTGSTIVFVTHDVGEAILMADRITVMTPGPAAAIREMVELDLRRPRSFGDDDFGRLYQEINGLLGLDI